MSQWAEAARSLISKVHAGLDDSATLKDRRRALRAVGPGFHGGTYWGRKVWGREVRKYLERHGLPPRSPRDLQLPDDIAFPFAAGANDA
jgi:hypothetical protein